MTAAEQEARQALRASMHINGHPMKGEGMKKPEAEPDHARLPRVSVDLKIPLWGIGSGAVVLLWGLIGMYFTLQDVSMKVGELQLTVKAANATTIQLASDTALLKYRIEKLEAQTHFAAPAAAGK